MNKKIATIAACAAAILPVAAVTAGLAHRTASPKGGVMEPVKAETLAATPAQSLSGPKLVDVRMAPQRANNSFEELGTLTPLLEEDFHLCSGGDLLNPDVKTKMWIDSEESDDKENYSPWRNMKPGYTTMQTWGLNNVYQAGGCVFLYASEKRGQAHINTPVLDCSKTDQICVLEFKTMTEQDTGYGDNKGLLMECAETNNMGPSWNSLDPQLCPAIPEDGKWYTVRALFQGTGPTTIFNLCQMLPQGCYIDDVKVYDVNMFLKVPELLPYTDYTPESFVANWKPVDGAEKYLVSVYTQHDEFDEQMNKTSTRWWIYQDLETTDTHLTVPTTGENHAENYFVMVKAVGSGHESLYSLPQNVWNLVAPGEVSVLPPDDGRYTYIASWDPVVDAERYNYYAYRERTAETDGPFVVTDEDFTNLYYPGSDAETDVTPETDADKEAETEKGHWDDFYPDSSLTQQGWHATMGYPGAGMMRIDAWMYINGGKQACLMSPELDLSKDGGKAHLSIDLYGTRVPLEAGWQLPDGTPIAPCVQAAVAAFTWNPEKKDYDQVFFQRTPQSADGVEDKWKTFEFDVENCTDRTIIGIFAIEVDDFLYLDNLKITQNYQKGDKFLDPAVLHRWVDGTSTRVALPACCDFLPIYHRAQAVRSRVEGEGQMANSKFLESDFSPMTFVMNASDVKEITLPGSDIRVSIDVDVLTVTGTESAELYDTAGHRLAKGLTMRLPGRGVYLVRTAHRTVKVIY